MENNVSVLIIDCYFFYSQKNIDFISKSTRNREFKCRELILYLIHLADKQFY
jgi:hypothetical protein